MNPWVTGYIRVKETGLPLPHVWVRAVCEAGDAAEAVRTGPDGAFALSSQGADRVEVRTRGGVLLATEPLKGCEGKPIDLALDQDSIDKAGVRSTTAPGLLHPGVIPTLSRGVEQLPLGDQANARLALDQLTCALPPVLTIPDLIDLARSVVEGRSGATAAFRERLGLIEAWSFARVPRRSTPPAKILQTALNAPPTQHAKHTHGSDRLFDTEALLTLAAAVGVATRGDSLAQTWQAWQSVHGQLRAVQQLRPLMGHARSALFGSEAALSSFRFELGVFGGLCGPGLHPFPGPAGGSGGWPIPNPGDWHDPLWYGPIDEDCLQGAGEAIRAGRRVLAGTADRIEPADACPGEVLHVFGSGLRPDGVLPLVGFAVAGSRAHHFVRAEANSTDSELLVIVPADATCGELELEVPTTETLERCGFEVSISLPLNALRFEGGRTQIRYLATFPGTCLRSGGPLEIAWEVCNAQALELRIQIGDDPPDSIGLDAGIDRYTLTLPDFDEHATVLVTLTVTGRCGEDSRMVRRGIQRAPSRTPAAFGPVPRYENWHRNVVHRRPVSFSPTTLEELMEAVRTAELLNLRLGVEGSSWSFTDNVVPNSTGSWYLNTVGLNRLLPGSPVMSEALLSNPGSILSGRARAVIDAAALGAFDTAEVPIRDRLVHVEAGIKLFDLNRALDGQNLAIPNLGGSRGQSLAGAIQTGTHGATTELPPIPDLVRAIHLVGNGGQQWWIERRGNPVTDPEMMEDLKARAILEPCLEVHYDDDLFDAVLVSAGHAGIVYAYIVETTPLHNLCEVTRRMSWDAVKAEVPTLVLGSDDEREWYYEVSVNPTRSAWVTTRTPSACPVVTPPPNPPTCACVTRPPGASVDDAVWLALFGTTAAALGPVGLIGAGTGALAFVLGGLATYFARRSAELSFIAATPPLWYMLEDLQEEIDLIDQLIRGTEELVGAIGASGPEVDDALARAMPDLLSALWRIGFYMISGKQLLDTVQNLFTTLDQRPPGMDLNKSYMIFTEQLDAAETPVVVPPATDLAAQTHTGLQRLVHSQEYAVPAERLLEFADAVLEAADHVRDIDDDALIVILNLRWVLRTTASIGLQQFDRTGLIEVWTIDRLEGNEAFHASVFELANEFQALPHWGHVHEVQDYSERFTRSGEFQRELDRIASHAGRPNTFRRAFGRLRGLVTDI